MTTGPRFELLSPAVLTSAAAAAAGNCFQRPGWVQAVAAARARPHRLVGVRAHWPDGREALRLGAVHRRFGLPVFESMPMGGYGGWQCADALGLDDEHALNWAWLAQARWPVVVLTSEPGRATALPAAALGAWWPRAWRDRLAPRACATHVLGLAGDDAALLQRMRPKLRGCLRKAGQLGFEFDIRHDAPALADFHRWFCQGSQAWQRPADGLLPAGFFTALADPQLADVWTVRHADREVGMALFLVGSREVQYQASGTQRIESPVSATEAVLWAAIRHYRDRGLALMNFGASEGLDSVASFKEKFGATAVPYLRVSYLLPALLSHRAAPTQPPAQTSP